MYRGRGERFRERWRDTEREERDLKNSGEIDREERV